jgi:hypothetical protein
MEMLRDAEGEDCFIMLPESKAVQEFQDLMLASSDNSLISPSFNKIDEAAQEELTVVPLMEMVKDAMTLVCQIDKLYSSLDTKASEIAMAFSKIAPEHYATIDFMGHLLTLTDSLLDKLPQGRETNLVVLLEHFEQSRSSTKIVTNMTVHHGTMEEEQDETAGEIVSSSSSANFERKRGCSFPNVSEVRVNFLAVLANKINQQVYLMRVEKCKNKKELQQLVSAPIFNPKTTRQPLKPSLKVATEFLKPVLQAINAKLATFRKDDAPGDDEEEEGPTSSAKSDEEKQEGGGSARKRPRIDTEHHPQEEIIKITKQKQVSAVQLLPTNPLISGLSSTSFPDLKKYKLLVEEVRSHS